MLNRSHASSREILTVNLDNLAGLAAGVGLPAFIYSLFDVFGSKTLCLFCPPVMLSGLPFTAAPCAFPFILGAGFGVGWSMMVATLGLMNIPYPCGQAKYRWPWTSPSFFPVASSSSTPTHSPVAKWVLPAKRTVAVRPSESSTDWPT